MSRLLSLTKVSLKNILSFRDGKVKRTKLNRYLPLLLLVIMIPSLGTYVFLVRELVLALMPFQQEGLIIGLLLSVSAMVVFFFGIFLIPSVFYFSKDIETLLSLPLKPYEILTSKLIVSIIYEYMTEAVIFAVILAAYIPLVQPGFLFYVYGIIVFILLPLVPLIIDAFIIMLIMMFLPFAKNRDFFNYLSGFLALVFAIGINVFVQNNVVQMTQTEIVTLLQAGNNSLMNFYTVFIPTIPFAVKAMVSTSIIDILIYIGITVVFFVVFIFLAQLLYFRGVIGVGETGANRKNLSDKAYAKVTTHNKPIMTYALKELNIMLRTPVYFMNNISTVIIMPVIMFVALGPNLLAEENTSIQQIASLLPWHTIQMSVYALTVGLAAGLFMSGMNLITCTAISREGSNVWFMKSIPMSYFDQALAKIIPGLGVSFIGGLFFVLPIGFILHADVISYLMALIGLILGVIAMNFWGLIVDIYHPKLVWEQETAAVKQNINAVFTMLPGFGISGALVFLLFKLSSFSGWMVFGLLLSISIALALGSIYLVHAYCDKGVARIEA